MDLVLSFKKYLLEPNTGLSKVTVKNYVADIRKFICWFEAKEGKSFMPDLISPEIIEEYIERKENEFSATSSPSSARSLKRYCSSLNKFFSYLASEGLIPTNPVHMKEEENKTRIDPWYIKKFKDYLYTSNASKLTIKNYLIDLEQFLSWAKVVLNFTEDTIHKDDMLLKIDSLLVEEYKKRMLNEVKLSPVSLNRKLSSLRKYFYWAYKTGLLDDNLQLPKVAIGNSNKQTVIIKPVVRLQSLASQEFRRKQNTENPHAQKYSKFPPLRLFQKTTGLISLLFDLIIIASFIKSVESIKYNLWRITGRRIFAPLDVVLDSSLLTEESTRILSNPEIASTGNQNIESAKAFSLFGRFVQISHKRNLGKIHNVPKSVYAPLKISTKSLPIHKKILHHMRHTRPAWYRRYHSYRVIRYFHIAVLGIFIITTGFGLYASFIDKPRAEKVLFAVPPTAPPRVIPFRGRLTDTSNTPIAAGTPLRFGIYNSQTASGSALLWQEVQSVTPDHDGVFSVLLGEHVRLSQNVFSNNASLYLGISVGNDPELQPRQQIATVSYAANAATLQGLSPITQLNAGTANVLLALDSSGNLTIGGSATPIFQATGGQFTIAGQRLRLTTIPESNSNVQISPDGSGIIDLQKPLQNTTNNNNILSAQGAVEVADLFAILATSSAQSALTINQNSTGPIISASSSGTAKFTVDYLGSGTFAGHLAVNGSNFTTTAMTFNLANTNTITLKIGGEATAIFLGASSGTTTINNGLTVSKGALFNGGAIIPTGQTLNVMGSIASNLTPLSHNSYDLGSSSVYWNNAYITNLFTASTATVSGFFQRNNNTIAPLNITDDLLLGSNESISAKFAFLNVSSGIPTASISAITNNNSLIMKANGNILTTNKQSLVLGNSEATELTGNILLNPNGIGYIGIGIHSPGQELEVNGDIRLDLNQTGNGWALCHTGSSSNDTTDVDIVDCSGAPSADYAEMYPVADGISYGDVVTLGSLSVTTKDGNTIKQLVKSSTAYDPRVIGIVSDNYGDFTSAGYNIDDGDNPMPVALNGRVPVNIASVSEAIEPGDFITTSIIEGKAQKATKAGYVIGKALESWSPAPTSDVAPDKTQIMVFVNLTWADPNVALTTRGELNTIAGPDEALMLQVNKDDLVGRFTGYVQNFIEKIELGFLEARHITADSLTIATENITIGGQSIHDYIASVAAEVVSAQLSKINSQPIISPLASQDMLYSNIISPVAQNSNISISLDDSKLTVHADKTGSGAAVASIDNQGNASFSSTLAAKNILGSDASFSGILRAKKLIADDVEISEEVFTRLGNMITHTASSEASATNPPSVSSGEMDAYPTPTTTITLSLENNTASVSSPSPAYLATTFDQIANIKYVDIASFSAELAYVPNLKSDFATFTQGIIALGPSSLADTAIRGELSIGSNMIVDEGAINTIRSDLHIQPLRQGNLSIMGGIVTIDTDGNLNVGGKAVFANDLTVKGKLSANIIAPIPDQDIVFHLGNKNRGHNNGQVDHASKFEIRNPSGNRVVSINQLGDLIASGSGTFGSIKTAALNIVRGAQADTSFTETVATGSAGWTIITANEIERTIVNPSVTKDSLIYLTLVSDSQGVTPYIARQTVEDAELGTKASFTIRIPYPVRENIKVNWLIVN